MNSGFIIWEYPLLKRLVVYRFIPMSMHDWLGFESYIPIRHAYYYDGKQSKWEKKSQKAHVLLVIFKFESTFLSISASMLLAVCSRISSTWSSSEFYICTIWYQKISTLCSESVIEMKSLMLLSWSHWNRS